MFQFTHPGKGATPAVKAKPPHSEVSIHAPWEGCDISPASISLHSRCFNSRTLGRVRLAITLFVDYVDMFQFTHPGKGATLSPSPCSLRLTFQFTHPGKGATRSVCSLIPREAFQFTHPGKGATFTDRFGVNRWNLFQFTHPGKGATSIGNNVKSLLPVSIHAPWEGCDRL